MNTAWNNLSLYGPMLEKIYGIVFFGVPHRGADLAYWAGLPASLLDHGLLGFGGNRAFLKVLERNSGEWRTISRDFVQRAAQVSVIRTFYETERLGNLLVCYPPSTATTDSSIAVALALYFYDDALTKNRLWTKIQLAWIYRMKERLALLLQITAPCVGSTISNRRSICQFIMRSWKWRKAQFLTVCRTDVLIGWICPVKKDGSTFRVTDFFQILSSTEFCQPLSGKAIVLSCIT